MARPVTIISSRENRKVGLALKPTMAAVAVAVLVVAMSVAVVVQAADPDPLQDFCVADFNDEGVFVNGFKCKNPASVTTEDFAFSGLAKRAAIINPKTNLTLTSAKVSQWPALNTLGMSIVRADFNPGGIIVPHIHHLATEISFCLKGSIYVGFVTNSDNPAAPNKLFAKVVKKGEAFIFPRGLVHFSFNKGPRRASSINFFNSQNPGSQAVASGLFGTNPPIDTELLAKSFFITEDKVTALQAKFAA